MKKVIAAILLVFGINMVNSQVNIDLLFSGKYKLYKHTYGSKSDNIYESPFFKKGKDNDTLEIKKVTDFSVNRQKYIKSNGFSANDTVSIVEWDIYGNLTTCLTKIDKVKYIAKDTCLLFYDEKLINDSENLRFHKWYKTPRKFKILKCTETEVVLLDRDLADDKRTYYFKAVKFKKKK